MLLHWPWPEHEQMRFEHERPIHPTKHVHSPLVRSHSPLFEHSAGWCAVVSVVGRSANAVPTGHVP